MSEDARVEAAALGIINAQRTKYGLNQIDWDFPALSSAHKEDAIAQATAALAAADRLSPDTAAVVAAERERCAKIADERAKTDHEKYQNETDWRMPYAFNRVIRASMDIAAAIRQGESASVPAGVGER